METGSPPPMGQGSSDKHLKGLKKYGMFVADDGLRWTIFSRPDSPPSAAPRRVPEVEGFAFEVVEPNRNEQFKTREIDVRLLNHDRQPPPAWRVRSIGSSYWDRDWSCSTTPSMVRKAQLPSSRLLNAFFRSSIAFADEPHAFARCRWARRSGRCRWNLSRPWRHRGLSGAMLSRTGKWP